MVDANLNTSLFGGTILLQRHIGSGSQGTRVFLARHERFGRCVLKVIPRPVVSREQDRVRRYFEDEARCGRELHGPHIRAMHEAGAVDSLPELLHQEGAYYLVLEYLSHSLEDVLEEGALAPVGVRDLIGAIAAGLHVAHTSSPPIVHRDLKPGNVLLDGPSALAAAKVADFGIARQEGGDRVTSTAQSVGTHRYMPPEQFADSSRVGTGADVYALALLAWECLTGEVPNAHQDYRRTLDERLAGTLPSLVLPNGPSPATERALRHALARNAVSRPTVLEFAESFAAAGLEDGLWIAGSAEQQQSATESLEAPGENGNLRPPDSVEEIGDLGRKKPYVGFFLKRRRRFAVLWGDARKEAEGRGWKTNLGSMVELYMKGGPSTLASRVWLSPTEGVLRVRVTPFGPRERTELLDKLGTLQPAPGHQFRFTVRDDGQVEAGLKLVDFFAGASGHQAMAERISATARAILDVVS